MPINPAASPLPAADYHVDRHFAVGIQGKIKRLELVVSGELFVEAGCRIEASDNPCSCVLPVAEFLIAERELLAQRRSAVRPTHPQYLDRLERAGDVPTRHHVGEGVVVYILVVLVRTDDVTDVSFAICLRSGAGCPEPGGLQQNLRPGIAGQRARTHGDPFVRRVGGAAQVVHRKPQRLLRLVVALDDDITRVPTLFPRGLVRAEHRAPAQCTAARQGLASRRNRIVFSTVSTCRRHNPIEFDHLSGDGTPAPVPTQRERALWDQQRVSGPQCRTSRHSDTLV
jgi:hypothetical protein